MKNEEQQALFDVPADWEKAWSGMPEFSQKDLMPWQSIKVHFKNVQDRQAFSDLIGQKISDLTPSVWFPKQEFQLRTVDPRFASNPHRPRYPIYIVSKGRWESRQTSKALEQLGIPYHIVIEPQEYANYAAVVDPAKILTLPFSNLGQGSIPARNWIWEHAIGIDSKRHWILDDNIRSFMSLHDNQKLKVADASAFTACEDFTDRFENVAISGMNYDYLAKRKQKIPAFYVNTRIYSCILLKNDLPYRWRGRYNEDTDLCLRALKDGWCTLLLNAFLAEKATTLTMKGGNTDELYQGDGRLKMAESLRDQHPDVVTITEKWGRAQHHVNYKIFSKNKLILKENASMPEGLRQPVDPEPETKEYAEEAGQLTIFDTYDLEKIKASWAAIQHSIDAEHVKDHMKVMKKSLYSVRTQ